MPRDFNFSPENSFSLFWTDLFKAIEPLSLSFHSHNDGYHFNQKEI